jgi:hypothetical protein
MIFHARVRAAGTLAGLAPTAIGRIERSAFSRQPADLPPSIPPCSSRNLSRTGKVRALAANSRTQTPGQGRTRAAAGLPRINSRAPSTEQRHEQQAIRSFADRLVKIS